jgi:hypothetical protein
VPVTVIPPLALVRVTLPPVHLKRSAVYEFDGENEVPRCHTRKQPFIKRFGCAVKCGLDLSFMCALSAAVVASGVSAESGASGVSAESGASVGITEFGAREAIALSMSSMLSFWCLMLKRSLSDGFLN